MYSADELKSIVNNFRNSDSENQKKENELWGCIQAFYLIAQKECFKKAEKGISKATIEFYNYPSAKELKNQFFKILKTELESNGFGVSFVNVELDGDKYKLIEISW